MVSLIFFEQKVFRVMWCDGGCDMWCGYSTYFTRTQNSEKSGGRWERLQVLITSVEVVGREQTCNRLVRDAILQLKTFGYYVGNERKVRHILYISSNLKQQNKCNFIFTDIAIFPQR